jgi:tRNA threonylcarbamoyladenosine biosynthesis protein TsaB
MTLEIPLTLAIEASQTSAAVALLGPAGLRIERPLPADERSAKGLAPAIKALLAEVGRSLSELGMIAVTVGPGSFTSLRVGVTTAKTLAYALKTPVLGIGSLEALTAQAMPGSVVAVGIDAGRGQVYAGRFDTSQPGMPRSLAPVEAVDLADWQATLGDGWVTGPILAKPSLTWPKAARQTPATTWNLQAATVGDLALLRYQAGERDDLWKLAPLYVRSSAAEERRAARRSDS